MSISVKVFAEDNSVIIVKICRDMDLDTESILSYLDIKCMNDENLSKEVELRPVFVT
ncbi:hypothetical protein ACNFJN_13045 [Xenorhabdus budapestensis]|uniref:Uncharacterized protein n=1 Tax=Xenorhabdus budapestensis TaxID=290110 RepID=A0ABX7VDP5_XENBU|nr:hypothetical protein [Xenorhabdus budapestensis]QTL38625.1 hypothetical protein HGO23_12075 [Xenorhabdus budapestensis]